MPEREGEARTERERERERPFPKTFEARAVEVLIFPLASRNPLEKRKKNVLALFFLSAGSELCVSRGLCPSPLWSPFPSCPSLVFRASSAMQTGERSQKAREQARDGRVESSKSSAAARLPAAIGRQLAAPPSHRAPRTPPNKAHGALELLSFSRNLTINRKKGHLLGAQQQL